jgi:hypothetical protein
MSTESDIGAGTMTNRTPGPDPYLMPTPAGAFVTASEPGAYPLYEFMAALLAHATTPSVGGTDFLQWSGFGTLEEGYAKVSRLQSLGWLEGLATPRAAPQGTLETILHELLPDLTRDGKVLLADSHGLQIGNYGFSREAAEEISALSADIAALHQRRRGALNGSLCLAGSAWGLIDAAGQSRLGFWPLFAGAARFVLVVAGMPAFNRPQMVDLIWVLHQRYAAEPRS